MLKLLLSFIYREPSEKTLIETVGTFRQGLYQVRSRPDAADPKAVDNPGERRLPERPRIGVRLEEFVPREVRRLVVRRCEVRYLIERDALQVLRIWHTREGR
jgi:hypothetical protein